MQKVITNLTSNTQYGVISVEDAIDSFKATNIIGKTITFTPPVGDSDQFTYRLTWSFTEPIDLYDVKFNLCRIYQLDTEETYPHFIIRVHDKDGNTSDIYDYEDFLSNDYLIVANGIQDCIAIEILLSETISGNTLELGVKNLSITVNEPDPPEPEFPWFDKNWYDPETGRIYKDVLIKNFNAIEEHINELSGITISDIALPEVTGLELDDVSLTDVDSDNKILNLRSYLSIMDIVNLPLVVRTDGNIKITRVEYYGSDYKYHAVNNETDLIPNETYPFVYLNYNNHSLTISDLENTPTNCVLVGVLINNKLYTKDSQLEIPTDVLSLICNDKSTRTTTDKAISGNDSDKTGYKTFSNGKQTLITYHTESKNGEKSSCKVPRIGLQP